MKELSKQFKSKTVWLNILVIITAVTELLPGLSTVLGEGKLAILMFGFGVAGIVIRQYTTKPVSEK